MRDLKKRIQQEGNYRPGGIVKVDTFLNHQVDIELLTAIGQEFYRIFRDSHPTKILTLEASGIPLAVTTAQAFHIPMIFAKKSESLNLDRDVYCTEVYSYTRQKNYQIRVNAKVLGPEDRVLIVDDFLANGAASHGMIQLVQQAGAELCGLGIAIEKTFQPGGEELRQEGVAVHSLARIKDINEEEGIVFDEDDYDEDALLD